MNIETIKERIRKIKDSSQAQHRGIVETFKAIVEYLEELNTVTITQTPDIVFKPTPIEIEPIAPSSKEALAETIKKLKEKTIEHNTGSGSK